MDTKWATTELAWTAHPETGVSLLCSVCVCVFMERETDLLMEIQMVKEKR